MIMNWLNQFDRVVNFQEFGFPILDFGIRILDLPILFEFGDNT
jgi:hypothetical protein